MEADIAETSVHKPEGCASIYFVRNKVLIITPPECWPLYQNVYGVVDGLKDDGRGPLFLKAFLTGHNVSYLPI